MKFWDEWRGSLDGRRPVMYIKRLFHWRGFRLDLHKMIRADDPECFHTHPGVAVRFILLAGYVEESIEADQYGIIDPTPLDNNRRFRSFRPFDVDVVMPGLCHRVAKLASRASYSLWFRCPCTHDVFLIGDGWPESMRGRAAERN